MEKSLIGPHGEKLASTYLQQQGYEILKTNYKACGSEVDIIARTGDTLCFVEVKTRGCDDYGMPAEFVDQWKIRKIIRAARVFTGTKKYTDLFVRFDIIEIIHNPEKIEINHITDAFQDE